MPAPTDDETLSLSLHATGGYIPNESSKIDEPTFQVFLRARDYDIGYKSLLQAGDILCESLDAIVDGNRYLSFYQQSDVADMGYADGFFKFTLNFRCYVQRQKTIKEE